MSVGSSVLRRSNNTNPLCPQSTSVMLLRNLGPVTATGRLLGDTCFPPKQHFYFYKIHFIFFYVYIWEIAVVAHSSQLTSASVQPHVVGPVGGKKRTKTKGKKGKQSQEVAQVNRWW